MTRERIAIMTAVLLLGCSIAWAQAVGGGELFKQDYFPAASGGENQALLVNVERFHFNTLVLDQFKQGSYASVVADLRYVLNRFLNHPRALSLLGEVALITEEPKLAIPHFEEALRAYPQYGLTHAQYGHYLCAIGDYTTGISRLSRATEMQADLAIGHAWLAEAYFANGRLEQGSQAAHRARALGYSRAIDGEPSR